MQLLWWIRSFGSQVGFLSRLTKTDKKLHRNCMSRFAWFFWFKPRLSNYAHDRYIVTWFNMLNAHRFFVSPVLDVQESMGREVHRKPRLCCCGFQSCWGWWSQGVHVELQSILVSSNSWFTRGLQTLPLAPNTARCRKYVQMQSYLDLFGMK